MVLHQFPDIDFLKKRISTEWAPAGGWPTVILNASVKEAYRPDIKGPLSLFINLSGSSRAGVYNKLLSIDEDHYCLTNRQENYTLEIDSEQPVETFNIHFGESFMDEVYNGLITSADRILSDNRHLKEAPIHFFNHTYEKDAEFNSLINSTKASLSIPLVLDENLYRLMIYLLQKRRNILKNVENLPPLKQSTKAELYKRLSYSIDYIREHFTKNMTLDEIAEVSCLSKFHFLRLFKLLYGSTPQQSIILLRMQRAEKLLKYTSKDIGQIAIETGYENHSSFSRAFYRYKGVAANTFRAKAN